MTRLASGNRELLRETASSTARVQFLKEQGSYRGVRPYYTVTVLKPTGRPAPVREIGNGSVC